MLTFQDIMLINIQSTLHGISFILGLILIAAVAKKES